MLSLAANAEMIVLARLSRGWSQAELAHRIGRTPGLVSKVENGIVTATSALVGDIAAQTEYPASFFFRPERVRGSDSICFHHRKRESMPVKLLISIEGAMHITQLHVKSLMEDLEIEAPNEFVTLDPDFYEGSPARVAQMVRSLWHVPSGPIPNLVNLVESAGGVVVFRRFGTAKLDGMSCWSRNTPPLFFINADIPMDRARLTIAHELGHLVMHFTAPAGDPEAEANEFALEFLAPAAEMAPDLRALRFPKLGGLKAKWGLSMAAILMAASRRGALTPSQSKSMWVQLSRYGYRKVEPFPLPIEEPTLMEQSIRIHRDEHGYSTDELATMVDLLPGEFERLYPLRPDRHPALSVLQ